MHYEELVKKYIPEGVEVAQEGSLIIWTVTKEEVRTACTRLYHEHGLPLKIMTAQDKTKEGKGVEVHYIFGIPYEAYAILIRLPLGEDKEFPSLVADVMETYLYERKIMSFFGLTATDCPDPRALILHDNWPKGEYPLRKDFDGTQKLPMAQTDTPYPFAKVEGEGIYEIPVGPVHAGIIEPGHFRFSVLGEEIIKLEAQLGWVHKGVEKLFETLPTLEEKTRLAERVSGDSTVAHAIAWCQAIESLMGVTVPLRAQHIRAIMAESERIANHLNDIGFIMLDTAFTFGGASGARLREMVMQWHEKLTGNRYMRGAVVVGGVSTKVNQQYLEEFVRAITAIGEDLKEVIHVADDADTLQDRLKTTGTITAKLVKDFGGVGVAARATGFAYDARKECSYGAYASYRFDLITETAGDVDARFKVRIREVYESIKIITQATEALKTLADTTILAEHAPLRADAYALGIVEGWRGDIVYQVATDKDGVISSVQLRDPSFLNWPLVTYAVLGNIVPDFPLINKSFNLSYSGNDL